MTAPTAREAERHPHRRGGRGRLSHVHFPNGTVADTADRAVAAGLAAAAVCAHLDAMRAER